MKKIISLALAAVMALAILSGCGSADKTVYARGEFPALGMSLDMPQEEWDDWTVLFGPMDQSQEARGQYPYIDGGMMQLLPMEGGPVLFDVRWYALSDWEQWTAQGLTPGQITGMEDTREILRDSARVYVRCINTDAESQVPEGREETYQRVSEMMPHILESITIHAADTVGEAFPAFETTDLDGNIVTSDSFSAYDLTMINFWGTFCGPCIAEMPDLVELGDNLPQGVRLLGIVTDALSDSYVEKAREIAQENGLNYGNLVPDQALNDYVSSQIVGVPTTVFVNREGKIVGETLLGSRAGDDYLTEILARLPAETGSEALG